MQAIPLPREPADLSYFAEFFNTETDDDLRLLLAWMIFAWNPNAPFPILVLQGEAGSAKTSLANMVRQLIDPAAVPLRAFPRDERDLVIGARLNHVLCYDNLSGIRDRDADVLCRISTGAGFATRQLYSNFDETMFQMTRPIIMNGIDDLATRSDLADRAIVLTLPPIAPDRRQEESTLKRNFEGCRPHLIGALLQVLVESMRRHPETVLSERPRMADFARWSTAAEEALGWQTGGFMACFLANQRSALDVGIESSVLAEQICTFMAKVGHWRGTATELLHALEGQLDEHIRRAKSWPQNASQLSGQLKRVAPGLRGRGIDLIFDRASDAKRTRIIQVTGHAPPGESRTGPSAPSAPSMSSRQDFEP
jgi:hypothetical protein